MYKYSYSIFWVIILIFCVPKFIFANPESISQADIILDSIHTSGAIAMTPPAYPNDLSASPLWVNPYFSLYQCLALITVYDETGDTKYLSPVRDFLDWYIENLNPDGTIYDFSGNFSPVGVTSLGTYDSSDSYAAMFLVVANEYTDRVNSTEFLVDNIADIKLITDAMLVTLDPLDGLTYAFPGYDYKYLMDNIEVRRGIQAAQSIASILGASDPNFNELYFSIKLNQNEYAIKGLWDTNNQAFYYAKHRNGSYVPYSNAQWGASGIANSLALLLGVRNDEPLGQDLLNKIEDDYLGYIETHPEETGLYLLALSKFRGINISNSLFNMFLEDFSAYTRGEAYLGTTYNSLRSYYILGANYNLVSDMLNTGIRLTPEETIVVPPVGTNNPNIATPGIRVELPRSGNFDISIILPLILSTVFTIIFIYSQKSNRLTSPQVTKNSRPRYIDTVRKRI